MIVSHTQKIDEGIFTSRPTSTSKSRYWSLTCSLAEVFAKPCGIVVEIFHLGHNTILARYCSNAGEQENGICILVHVKLRV